MPQSADMPRLLPRLALTLALSIGGTGLVRAADMGSIEDTILRGGYVPELTPAPQLRWDGFYAGGQIGRAFTTADFGSSSTSQISYILANTELQSIVSSWTTLPSSTNGTQTYGAFAGVNGQWNELVGSLELNYNHVGSTTSASGSLGPINVPGATQPNGDTVLYSVSVDSSASAAIKDVLTARARAGWAYEQFLPYAFAGVAVGRAEVTRTTSVTGTKSVFDKNGNLIIPSQTNTGTLPLPRSPQVESESLVAYGYTLGLGVDVALMPNVFLRGEWEFTQFPNVDDVRIVLNSVHAAVGVRF